MKTLLVTKQTAQPAKWHLIDADGVPLGRLAVKAANLIRGRHKAAYTPNFDNGDFVVVINAEKVVLTGKKEDQNEYMFFSGYVGGETYKSVKIMRERRPDFLIHHAVKGMMPKNRIARRMLTKLRVFQGPEHTHAPQSPQKIKV
ncbi:MAG: 50S ribosomal protein L13 [Opitutaceae bacterium]|nr:50S ribosomal protein L13 [Opitutaceae bacterium]